MPKLLIVVPTMHQGGQERVVVRTSRLLMSKYDITIAIFDGSDVGYDTEGLNIVNLDVPAKPGKINKLINIVKRVARLKRLKKQLKPDISYSYGPSANIINASSRVGTEKIWVGLRNYTDAVDVSKMKICVRGADLIVCCARDIETEVKRRFGEETKTAVLYNLYDIDGIKAEATGAEPDDEWFEFMRKTQLVKDAESVSALGTDSTKRLIHLMSMGRDDDQKMFWHMLKTFKLIHEVVPEARLTILGAGTWEDFKTMAEELGLAKYVYFTGPQLNPYRFLKYGDIHWMTSRNEGFPNALAEGMVLGMASVSTNCLTGPAEILIEGGNTYQARTDFENWDAQYEDSEERRLKAIYGEYGIITPELSRERDMDSTNITDEERSLAEVMISLLQNKEMLENYKQAAAARAQKYSYEAYVENFSVLVDKV